MLAKSQPYRGRARAVVLICVAVALAGCGSQTDKPVTGGPDPARSAISPMRAERLMLQRERSRQRHVKYVRCSEGSAYSWQCVVVLRNGTMRTTIIVLSSDNQTIVSERPASGGGTH